LDHRVRSLRLCQRRQLSQSSKIKVVTCHAEDDLQKALDAMSGHKLRRIPVVDNDNAIVGIIAQADVATRVDQPEKTAAMVRGISQSD
jgi:CBS domain-containing protein